MTLVEEMAPRSVKIGRAMRLAIATSFPSTPDHPRGGVQSVSVNLTRALAKRDDLEVHVITLDDKATAAAVSKWENATIHRLPAGSGPLLMNAVGKYRRQVQSYLEQLAPDVIHAHDNYGIMVKGMKMPRVFTVHGFIYEDTRYAGGVGPYLRSLAWKSIETSAWADQPHVVSISPYVRERLTGIASGVIHDIENPISPEYFSVKRKDDGRTVFCAASIGERKNTLGLVKAFATVVKKHPDAQLRWAGSASDANYEKSVRDFINANDLSRNVTLLGSIPAVRLREELSRASVFALISFEEGAPMGIAEAMATGLPIVTSNRCGMPYMVREGESGFLVSPNNLDEVAARIGDLLGNAQLRAKMGDRAIAFALEHFHPDRVAERTCAVYRKALANGHFSAATA